MDSAGPGFSERASPDRGWWERSQRNLAKSSVPERGRDAARSSTRARGPRMSWKERFDGDSDRTNNKRPR